MDKEKVVMTIEEKNEEIQKGSQSSKSNVNWKRIVLFILVALGSAFLSFYVIIKDRGYIRIWDFVNFALVLTLAFGCIAFAFFINKKGR